MLHPLRIRCEQANWKVSNIVNCISSNHCVCTILYRLFASCDTKSLRSRIYAVQTLGTSRCGLCAWYRDWLLWSAGVSSVLQHMNHGWTCKGMLDLQSTVGYETTGTGTSYYGILRLMFACSQNGCMDVSPLGIVASLQDYIAKTKSKCT